MSITGSIIKNPLTIIAIFAGIVEVGSNSVLPFLTDENQATYIWFLMLFPLVLVLIFFFILYNKHEVLYAPSDFNDESNFRDILNTSRKSTVSEVNDKMNDELRTLKEEYKKLEKQSKKKKDKKNKDSEKEVLTSVATKEIPKQVEAFREMFREKRTKFLSIIEKELLKIFKDKYFDRLETNVTIENQESKLIIDGIVLEEDKMNIVEVKILSTHMAIRHIIRKFIQTKYDILKTISKDTDLTISFIVITPDDRFIDRYTRIENLINEEFSGFNIKIYPNIINELDEAKVLFTDIYRGENNQITFK